MLVLITGKLKKIIEINVIKYDYSLMFHLSGC